MDTLRFCPQCQQPLSANAPEGLCPQCLMKAAAFPTSAPSEPQPVTASGPGIVDIGNAAEVAKRLPQFEILELLGRGGMGVVYKARQLNLDRIVALKILPPADSQSADFIERFRREARSLAKLLRRDQTDHTLTMTGMTLGTPRYMAPSSSTSRRPWTTARTYHSLGVVFYEMLTGEVPMGRFVPPSEKVQVDVKLDEIVLRSLERDVQRRYQHASEIKMDVEKVTSKPQVALATPPASASPAAVTTVPVQAKHLKEATALATTAIILLGLWSFVVFVTTALPFYLSVRHFGQFGPGSPFDGMLALASLLITNCVPSALLTSAWRQCSHQRAWMAALGFVGVSVARALVQSRWGFHPVRVEIFFGGLSLVCFLVLRFIPAMPAAFAAQADSRAKPTGILPSMMIFAGVITFLSAVFTALLVTGVFVERQRFDAFFRQDSVTITLLVMQALALPCGVMMLIAGLSAATSPGLARTAAKLACVPLTPAWLITLALGIAVLGRLPRAARGTDPSAVGGR